MTGLSTVRRTQVDAPQAEDGSIRVYYDPTTGTPPMPSVSVIKDLRVDLDKQESLSGWRDRYDGTRRWKQPWWKDQRQFKALRGTLIHFTILNELGDAAGDTYYHEVGEKDWGGEEYYAEYCLKKWSKKAPSANDDDVPYTPQDNEYDGEHAWDKAVRDMKWAARAFKSAVIDGNTESSHFDWAGDDGPPSDVDRFQSSNVREVESYVFDQEYGYGGQYDLLYDTTDGRTVLADIKTSSAIRFDHKLQSAAYKHAVESRTDVTIDECEIIRLHPDSETVELSRSPEWDRTLDGLEHEFLGLVDHAWNVAYIDELDAAREELMGDDAGQQADTGREQATDADDTEGEVVG